MRADQNEIIGIKRLVEMRKGGEKPSVVFVLMTDAGRLSLLDVAIPSSANIARMDFRPFIGLNVVLMAATTGGRPRAVFRKLCEVADSVVMCFDDRLAEGDPGWRFVRGEAGIRRIGDAPAASKEAA